MKVILHIDMPERRDMVLDNAANLLRYASENNIDCTAEIVANGASVRALHGEALTPNRIAAFDSLASAGVTLAACNNSLHKFCISPDSLPADFIVVPAGVAELILRQEDGYTYIKP